MLVDAESAEKAEKLVDDLPLEQLDEFVVATKIVTIGECG